MEKSKGIDIISFIIGIILGSIVSCGIINSIKKQNNTINIENADTTYNKVVLDSIEYNIIKKDSIIVEYKNKFEYEKEQAINDNDSSAIERFKSLASE